MRNLPIYPNPKANVLVDQRDRWFAWGQAVGLFGSLLDQRAYHPMTSYNVAAGAYTDLSGNAQLANVVTSGLFTGIMDGPVNAASFPGNTTDYLEIPDANQLECEYPVVAFWARINQQPGLAGTLYNKCVLGAPHMSYAWLINAAGSVYVRLSADGTNVTDTVPGNPADITVWNFYAFQHRSATITNILVNDTLTVANTGYATIYTAGNSQIRIGRSTTCDMALMALANDNSANCVQKLLGLYYHSRYAFRDDWT